MLTTSDIKKQLQLKLKNKDFVIDKSGVKMIELLGSTFVTDEYSIIGDFNEEYIKIELDWYKSMSLNVWDLKRVPQIWKNVSDKNGNINSNYGWCIYSKDNGYQFKNVVRELKSNEFSRRAQMIYSRPSMHTDYNKNGMQDFMCTNNVDYFIRDNKLHCIVSMRSNDVRFGFLNDIAWQRHVLFKLLEELVYTYKDLKFGDIIWQASSLHVYERDFNLLELS